MMRFGLYLEKASFLLICLLALSLPFEAHHAVWKLWGLTPVKMMFVLATVLAVAASGMLRNWPRHLPPVAMPAALLCVALLLAALAAPEHRENAVKSFLRYIVGLVLMLEVWYLLGQDPWHRRRRLLLCLGLGALASSVVGLAMLADITWANALVKYLRPFEYYLYFKRRFSGTFEYPNTAANYFVLTLPLAISWATALTLRSRRVVTLLSLGLLLSISLVLTYSRGGVASCALASLCISLLAWRCRQRRAAVWLAGTAATIAALYLPLGLQQPEIRNETRSPTQLPAIAAAYDLSETRIQKAPDSLYETDITIRNTGYLPWKNTPKSPLVLSFRWYDVHRKRSVWVNDIVTDLPPRLAPGAGIQVLARYRTPAEEGYYYLVWDILQFRERMPWSTRRKIIPGIAECFVARSPLDLKAMPRTDPYQTADGERLENQNERLLRLNLWKAGLQMFREHPWLGVGGGNFRMVYGRYLGLKDWDTRIHANSLVIEILTGCGIVGLAALVFFAWSVLRLLWKRVTPLFQGRAAPDGTVQLGIAAALLGFGLHNLVDYFMEFTPTYFAFWMILGMYCSDE